MSLRSNLTLSNFFLTAFLVLLAWTSFVQGAAIDRNILPAKRDFGGEVGVAGVNVADDNILRRDDIILATKPEGESLVRRDVKTGPVDYWYTLAARTTEDETPADADRGLQKRWYTLVEIAESEEGSE